MSPPEQLLADAHAAFLIGDENPMREPERWRKHLASRIKIPFWTVDTDVVVPSKLIEKAQYGAYTSGRVLGGSCRSISGYTRTHAQIMHGSDHAAFTPTRCMRI
jgi:hypothetical protein